MSDETDASQLLNSVLLKCRTACIHYLLYYYYYYSAVSIFEFIDLVKQHIMSRYHTINQVIGQIRDSWPRDFQGMSAACRS